MKIDGDMAELLGIHIGDGCISRTSNYAEYYLGGDITEEVDYHKNWVEPLFNRKVMNPVLKKNVQYKFHPKVRVYGFYIFNKKIVEFFEEFGISAGSKISIRVPKEIMKNSQLSKRFLRGLFDTDGSIYFDRNKSLKANKNNRPIIKLGTVSKYLIKDVYILLKNLSFHPRIKKPYSGKRNKNPVFNVLIYRVGDISRYIEEIGFKNPKHYTKWQIYKKFGFCPPKTKLSQRKQFLEKPKLFNPYLLG